MKKRILAMIFAVVMACGAAGCGNAEENTAEAPVEQPRAGEMIAYLQALPEEVPVELAVENGFYTIKDRTAENQAEWDEFAASCENDEEAYIMVCQYTTKGGAVLDFVTYHEDGVFEVVTDTTRDGYNDEKSVLRAPEYYTEMKVFENFILQEGGTEYTICVLSDDPDLTEGDFRKYWTEMTMEENGVYMLYVI